MSQTLQSTCPRCRTTLVIPTQWAGQPVKCKACGAAVRVTGPAAPQPAPAAYTPPAYANGMPAATAPYIPPAAPQPAPMVYDPATGAYVPAPVQPSYPYPQPQPGYPPAAPGYGPQPAHPYPPAGYPGYAPPAYAPAPANEFALEKRDRGTRRRYQKGNNGGGIVLVGLLFLLLVGGGAAAFVFKEQLVAMVNGGHTPPTGDGPNPKGPPLGGPYTPAAVATGTFNGSTLRPRRMLVLSVNKYLYCNGLTSGKNTAGNSELADQAKAFAAHLWVPTDAKNNQLYLLSDADGRMPASAARQPMLKNTISEAVAQFCTSSRPQDRVVIYFGGHAVAKDGKAYLVPSEGDLNEPDTLLPLADVWAQLAACPAQQKVVLFDVCRLSTDDNAVRPGSEPMSEELDTLLHTPPAGVQVVTSCSAGQTTPEFRTAADAGTPQGSAFLGALKFYAKQKNTGVTGPDPNEPLPVADWANAAVARIAAVAGKTRASTPRLAGSEGAAVAYDAAAPMPERFAFAPPPKGAELAEVKAVLTRLELPQLLGSEKSDEPIENVVTFAADAMAAYKPGTSEDDVLKDPKAYPARAAAIKALKAMDEKWRGFSEGKGDSVLKDGLIGEANDALRVKIREEQTPLANLELDLDDVVSMLTDKAVADAAEKEESKYWKGTYQYALAQAKLRLAFAKEANLALGNILTGSLPEGVDRGIQLVQVAKMKSKKEVTKGAKEAQEMLEEVAKENKGTPWEVVAKQWRTVSLGLEWRAKAKDADTGMEKE